MAVLASAFSPRRLFCPHAVFSLSVQKQLHADCTGCIPRWPVNRAAIARAEATSRVQGDALQLQECPGQWHIDYTHKARLRARAQDEPVDYSLRGHASPRFHLLPLISHLLVALS